MNSKQEQFYNFILMNTKNDKQEDAKALLQESFAKQMDGTFNQAYLETFIPKMLELIKEENIEQVKNIMFNFKSQL